MSIDPSSKSFSYEAFLKNRETRNAARKRRNEIAAGKPALQPPPMPGSLHRPQANFKLGNRPREFSTIARKQISGNLGRELRAKEERERLEKAVGVRNNDENNSPRSGRPELNVKPVAAAAAPVAAAVKAPAPAPAPQPTIQLGSAAGGAGGLSSSAPPIYYSPEPNFRGRHARTLIPPGTMSGSTFVTTPLAAKLTRRRKTQRRRR
jgi:hypothetical protein